MNLQNERSVKPVSVNMGVPHQATGITHAVPSMANHKELGIRSILLPVDFSEESRKAFEVAVKYAQTCRAKITLLHVAEPAGLPDYSTAFPLELSAEEIARRCKQDLERLVRDLSIDPELISKKLVKQGRSWDEICTTAKNLNVDLIIISTHGRTGIEHLLMGSTAERVVRHAPCSVLVIRAKQPAS